jgi:hypothetical protein
MPWLLALLLSAVALSVVGLTAVDKYDERTCAEDRRLVGAADPIISLELDRLEGMGFRYRECSGFLPW